MSRQTWKQVREGIEKDMRGIFEDDRAVAVVMSAMDYTYAVGFENGVEAAFDQLRPAGKLPAQKLLDDFVNAVISNPERQQYPLWKRLAVLLLPLGNQEENGNE